MIVKVANKNLKEPVELYLTDPQWAELQKIESNAELNAKLHRLAMDHIAKNGYQIGFCSEQQRRVTLKECMNCGVNVKGWARGAENYQKWELCKKDHIDYQFAPSEPLLRRIKDKRLEDKIKPQTKSEIATDNNTFSAIDNTGDRFERASEEIMKPIHDKEKNV